MFTLKLWVAGVEPPTSAQRLSLLIIYLAWDSKSRMLQFWREAPQATPTVIRKVEETTVLKHVAKWLVFKIDKNLWNIPCKLDWDTGEMSVSLRASVCLGA